MNGIDDLLYQELEATGKQSTRCSIAVCDAEAGYWVKLRGRSALVNLCTGHYREYMRRVCTRVEGFEVRKK